MFGAFKARGGINTLLWLQEQKTPLKRLVANSSGNHAQAVAWASQLLKIPATIYMPANISSVKLQATAGYGAQIVLGKDRDSTDTQTVSAAEEDGVHWIPPYNHPQIIAGQGTAALEAIAQAGEFDAVFAPCGGGGPHRRRQERITLFSIARIRRFVIACPSFFSTSR